ncbi:MAG: putative sulfate exporter family transporter [Pseudomonadota bacterium]
MVNATNPLARLQPIFPGLLLAVVIALASRFVSEHYGAPAMLLALLFGISLNFLADAPASGPGLSVGARTVLRAGVALLGLRISYEMVAALGWQVMSLVVLMVPATIAFGLLVARYFGFRHRFAILSSGAVAICGASAAIAIAAVLPQDERSEDRLVFTVVGVTILSTVAMVLYPAISALMDFEDVTAGIYIGATIHDVAQVVGAGFSISDAAGETATLVKLLRVGMLAPVVVLVALAFRRIATAEGDTTRPPLIPGFVVAFVALATLNSLLPIPEPVLNLAAEASGWLLLIAIAAVGVKTKPADVLKVGKSAAALLLAETAFLALVVLVVLTMLPL